MQGGRRDRRPAVGECIECGELDRVDRPWSRALSDYDGMRPGPERRCDVAQAVSGVEILPQHRYPGLDSRLTAAVAGDAQRDGGFAGDEPLAGRLPRRRGMRGQDLQRLEVVVIGGRENVNGEDDDLADISGQQSSGETRRASPTR